MRCAGTCMRYFFLVVYLLQTSDGSAGAWNSTICMTARTF